MSRITLIAQGTRGDAQPAVALGKALQAQGHRVRVLASANFAAWIAAHGLEAAVSTVDIQALMLSSGGQEWVESGHNPLAEVRAMTAATGTAPLLLLDDVMSELDQHRRNTLLDALAGVEQAIVTTTDWADFSPAFRAQAQLFHVHGGVVEAVTA